MAPPGALEERQHPPLSSGSGSLIGEVPRQEVPGLGKGGQCCTQAQTPTLGRQGQAAGPGSAGLGHFRAPGQRDFLLHFHFLPQRLREPLRLMWLPPPQLQQETSMKLNQKC